MKRRHGKSGKRHFIRGCPCRSCVARRAYQAQWHRDQRALRTPYARRHVAACARWQRRARLDPTYRQRERMRQRESYFRDRFIRLMYGQLRHRAARDPVWPWFKPGISEADREKLKRLVEAAAA